MRWQPLWQLMRGDKPIGTLLLLWPTAGALWLAAWPSSPALRLVLYFGAGVWLTRSAGCVINDLADAHWDGQVARTAHRPLVLGTVSRLAAWKLFVGLMVCALGVTLALPVQVWPWAVGAAGLMVLYPWMKRYTHYPQVILGLAWALGIPMAFVAQGQALSGVVWFLYGSVVLWVIAFDTYYAFSDWPDDERVGILSPAVHLKEKAIFLVFGCQLGALLGFLGVGWYFHLSWYAFIFWIGACFLVAHQMKGVYQALGAPHSSCKESNFRKKAFEAFYQNHWIGALFFLSLQLPR